ncbi:MAG: shikimate kinase [Ardenticatenales bacterium]|nr:shikimate kinase [Ardenticatenales bacterium]
MRQPIILMGPIGAGKSTVGRLLAAALDLPICHVDEVRWGYYEQLGYDRALADQIAAEQGLIAMLRYCEPFDVAMLEQLLVDHSGIIDLGASNSVYEDEALLCRAEAALAPVPYVILLLPSADPNASGAILKERLIQMLTAAGQSYSDELFSLNDYLLRQPANGRLAKQIVYTSGKQPDEICAEIVLLG